MLRSGTRALSGTGAVSAGEVLVTFPGFDVDDPETAGVLRDAGFDIRFAPKHGARTPSELRELTSDAVGAIASTDPFDRSVLESASRLRVIARTGVGTDSIDLEAATENGIVVATTPGLNEETAADHTMALILGAVRRLVEHDASMRRGEWDRGGALTAWDLHGATVGIVGLGVIGRAVAKRLQGFDVTVIASDPVVTAGSVPDVTMVELDELLDSAEVITLHVPKLASTSALIGREELARMRPGRDPRQRRSGWCGRRRRPRRRPIRGADPHGRSRRVRARASRGIEAPGAAERHPHSTHSGDLG